MRNCFIILIILSSLLMQACATTNVVTAIIPGKELSRASLGVREIDNRVMMEEVDPLSVKLYRRISTAEFTKSVFQAVNETRHEYTTYDCSNAYDRYIAFMVTTLTVPLLYEMATGFDLLREMCDKNPPKYLIETADTGKTLTTESFDKEKVVTQETPIAGEPVTVDIGGNKFVISTSTAGIATIPEKEIVSLTESEKSRSIDYQYKDVRLATPFKKRAQQNEALAESSAKSMSSSALSRAVTADDAPAVKRSELWQSKPDSTAIIGEQSATLEAAKENKRQGQENFSPELNWVARQLENPVVASTALNNTAQNTGQTTLTGTGRGEFTVKASPTVTSTSPDNVAQGTDPTTVTITGTGFVSGAKVAFSGTRVTTGAATVVNATTITVPVTVAAGATIGERYVTVTNADTGTGASTGGFTVNASPAVTSTSPDNMAQGTGPTTVTITGAGFVSDAKVAFSGAGVTTGAVTAVNDTTIKVPVTVAASATTGERNVTVTNTDTGTGTSTGGFTVNASPTVTSTSPDNMAQGAGPATVTITGSGFVSGANLVFSGTEVTTGAVTVVNDTTITVPVTVTAGATTGARNVTVINSDRGTGAGSGVFSVTTAAVKSEQSYLNEDENIRIIQQDKSIKISNKSNLALTIKSVSVHYNGRIIENLLSAPIFILPESDSEELNRGNVIGAEFNDITSFGIAASYQALTSSQEKSLNRVNRYADNIVSEDIEETARMTAGIKGMAAGSSAAAGNEASVSIGLESTSESSKRGEWKIILHVKFDTNKAAIKKEYFSRLKEIGAALKENPRLKGVIEGHTDSIGSRKTNQKLSVRRAGAVAQHLIKTFGISSDRLKIEGFGMDRPIADNATPKGRTLNRRIEAKFKNLSSSSIIAP